MVDVNKVVGGILISIIFSCLAIPSISDIVFLIINALEDSFMLIMSGQQTQTFVHRVFIITRWSLAIVSFGYTLVLIVLAFLFY